MEVALSTNRRRIAIRILAEAIQPLVGMVLIVAAILKVVEHKSVAMAVAEPSSQRLMMAMLIEAEVTIGFMAVAGVCRSALRALLVVLLSAFTAVAFTRMMSGATSCGCFGIVQVPPVISLVFDLLAIAGLCFVSVPEKPRSERSAAVRTWQRRFLIIGAVTVVAIAIILVIPSGRSAVVPGFWLVGDGAAVCEPGPWVGTKLPLLRFIDIRAELEHGRWNVLLYHPKCSECQKRLDAHLAGDGDEVWRRAAVQIRAASRLVKTHSSADVLHGTLSDELRWFLKTPVNVWLDDGIVIRIRKATTNK